MYHPRMASPPYNPPSRSSPIQSFHLDDDLGRYGGATSQPYQPFLSQDSKVHPTPFETTLPSRRTSEPPHTALQTQLIVLVEAVDLEDEEARIFISVFENKIEGIRIGEIKDGKRKKE
uniref:Uncharacterized protein n=1 Tax=Tanacetum cinerariifolium TaxID=118510 RepID=A0A6L2NKM4_TANCI|nr:hypothetical protein [Tanacetum cinerariifolium]